ncbi:MAG: tRNA pseudouridine(55) synthase TruB [Chloroflexi bacterium]|nr:tRNA pseudouridine(55) synthase TruB [Chloroflexota bacterium]
MPETQPVGFLNVNKPLNLTSHDVVAQVRRRCRSLAGSTKVGHAGTLDPLADGVLVICLGAATRLSEYVMRGRKVYRATIEFGAATTTYDAAGEFLERKSADHIQRADAQRVMQDFIGEIEQVPPMHSAIKVGGRKLYELARQGRTIEREPRRVTIHAIKLLAWRQPVADLEIECGAGTYIRSIANDMGAALGVGGYLKSLTRTASGLFKLEDSLALDAITAGGDDWLGGIVPPYDALSQFPRTILEADDAARLRQGRFIERKTDTDERLVFAFDADRQLVAILEAHGQRWKPRKVFSRQS